jgi:thiamine-phosphate pyrophosphorylase
LASACLIRQAEYAVEAGIDVIHVRERDLSGRELFAVVRELVAVAHGSGTRVVVNDRLDVALAAGAAGVHLRGDSFGPGELRRLVPDGFLIGRSVHSREEAILHAQHVDYLIAGTVWPTTSKPDAREFLGADGLARLTAAVSVPVIAIGGISVERVAEVARTGAAGIAAIGLFLAERSIAAGTGKPATPLAGCRARSLVDTVRAARLQFVSA